MNTFDPVLRPELSLPTISLALPEGGYHAVAQTLLLAATLLRDGDDLILLAEDGVAQRIDGFFLTADRGLIAPNGAVLHFDQVVALAHQPRVVAAAEGGAIEGGAGEVIATVTRLMGKVTARGADGVTRALKRGDAIYLKDVIETEANGFGQITFNDGTRFSLGRSATLIIESYLFDLEQQQGTMQATIVKGVFRYVSGQIGQLGGDTPHTTLKTPVSTIGVRGSEIDLSVAEDGTTLVRHTRGIIDVSDAFGNGTVTLLESGTASVVSSQGGVSQIFQSTPTLDQQFSQALAPMLSADSDEEETTPATEEPGAVNDDAADAAPDDAPVAADSATDEAPDGVDESGQQSDGEGAISSDAAILDILQQGETPAEVMGQFLTAEQLAAVLAELQQQAEAAEQQQAASAVEEEPLVAVDQGSGAGSAAESAPLLFIANNDRFVTAEDTPLVLDVLANDLRPNGPMTLVVDDPAVVVVGDRLLFTPPADFNGSYRFNYQLQDEFGASRTAEVVVEVTPRFDPPYLRLPAAGAQPDGVTLAAVEGKAVPLRIAADLLVNIDYPAAPFVVVVADLPQHGTLLLNGEPVTAGQPLTSEDLIAGNLAYRHDRGPSGSDSFRLYFGGESGRVSGEFVTAGLRVTYEGAGYFRFAMAIDVVNDPPQAVDDTFIVYENSTFSSGNLIANDIDPDSLLTVNPVPLQGVQHGELLLRPDGTFVYKPNQGFDGVDGFVYQISDGEFSSQATVTLEVVNVNEPPRGEVVIVGEVREDALLTADTSTLSDPDGIGPLSYQWFRGAMAIEGATGNSLRLDDIDVGYPISVTVSYRDGKATLEQIASRPTLPVEAVDDPTVGRPIIRGTPREKVTLEADLSTIFDPDGTAEMRYQWLRSGEEIEGAIGTRYTLTNDDVAKEITLRVTHLDRQGFTAILDSIATAAIENVPEKGTVQLNNLSPRQTDLLSVTVSDPDGISGPINYQWWRGGERIEGATEATYRLGRDDVGQRVRVTVDYIDDHGDADNSYSTPYTDAVLLFNQNPSGSVVILGVAEEKQRLVADTSTLGDGDGLGVLNFQWYRGTTAIVGATESSYILNRDDVGERISVKVSYIDAIGVDESVSSNPTPVVVGVNTPALGAPRLHGEWIEDATLAVDTTAISDVDGLGSFSYRWLRDGEAISGATGTEYTLDDADVGKVIQIEVTFDDQRGFNESLLSLASPKIAAVDDPTLGELILDGLTNDEAKEDATLRVDIRQLVDADGPLSVSYQWYRGEIPIPLATAASYRLGDDDVKSIITVRVTHTDGQGFVGFKEISTPYAVINNNDAGVVTLNSYKPLEGDRLTATVRDDDGITATISYQWLRDGLSIGGATASSYILVNEDVGKRISVSASYIDNHGTAEMVKSLATEPVMDINDPPQGEVVIRGEPIVKQILLADISTVSDADGIRDDTIQYQWLANGVEIAGATAAQLQLDISHLKSFITLRLDYIDAHGRAESLTSGTTDRVYQVNTPPEGEPIIRGSARVGESISVDTSSISDADGLGTFIFQWLRDGAPIAGMRGSSYTLSEADLGKAVSVGVEYYHDLWQQEVIQYREYLESAPLWVGGAGEQNFTLSDDSFAALDGGDGVDSLRLIGEEIALDLSQQKIRSIEMIDLANRNGNSLQISLADLLEVDNQLQEIMDQSLGRVVWSLRVEGGDNNHVSLVEGAEWQNRGDLSYNGQLYTLYQQQGIGLLIDSDIEQRLLQANTE
jgi:hypothetical protein